MVLIFAAVGLTGFISFRNGQQSVNKVASELRHEINSRIQERLRTYLETPKSINRLNANAARFGTLDLQEVNRVSSIFWQQIQAFELMSLIYVGKETGDYVGATRKDNAIAVNRVNASAGGFYSTYVPGDWGQPATLISAVTDRVYDPRKRPWYIATTIAKKPIWSPIYYGLERLISVIEAHWQQTAIAIREAAIADVYRHIGQHPIYDDITLVVLKKK